MGQAYIVKSAKNIENRISAWRSIIPSLGFGLAYLKWIGHRAVCLPLMVCLGLNSQPILDQPTTEIGPDYICYWSP